MANYSITGLLNYAKRVNYGLSYLDMFLRKNHSVEIFNRPHKLIAHVKESIERAAKEQSKLLALDGYNILLLEGMSSAKGRHLLNNLFSIDGINHLEIGTWQGSTLIASKYKNHFQSIAIDNWSQFGGPKEKFLENIRRYEMDKTTIFFDQDCFRVDLKEVFKNKKIQIYYFDGEHSYESQYKAFTYYDDVLDDLFIAIVDDYNSEDVQKGTRDAFKELKYDVLFERYLKSSGNADTSSWWNGTYIAVIKKVK